MWFWFYLFFCFKGLIKLKFSCILAFKLWKELEWIKLNLINDENFGCDKKFVKHGLYLKFFGVIWKRFVTDFIYDNDNNNKNPF